MESFWQKINKCGPDDCWRWTAAKDKDGYGLFFTPRPERKRWRVTRLLWTLLKGAIPDGMYVLHDCDEPSCCNIDHLWLGTAKDNTQDSIRKGRFVNPPLKQGEDNKGGGKLTEDNIREIRRLHDTKKYTLKQLGDMYDVTFGMIGHIVKRRLWKHIE